MTTKVAGRGEKAGDERWAKNPFMRRLNRKGRQDELRKEEVGVTMKHVGPGGLEDKPGRSGRVPFFSSTRKGQKGKTIIFVACSSYFPRHT